MPPVLVSRRFNPGACIPTLGLALLLATAGPWARAAEVSAAFQVTVELLSNLAAPAGVGCHNGPSVDSLECSTRPVVVTQAGGSDTRVILYGGGLTDDQSNMWGAVAASRRVKWAGRDYLELTLSW
jgi:hypothetical protein